MAEAIRRYPNSTGLTSDEILNRQVEQLNSDVGSLIGHDCPKCLNRGCFYIVQNGAIAQSDCGCKKQREDLKRIKQSGLGHLIDTCTFENYKTPHIWQQKALDRAMTFLFNAENGQWLYFGGQPGIGKTHLCTAAAIKLLYQGKRVRYMPWRDESTRIKSIVNETSEYAKATDDLKGVDVLYIDDLFKTQKKWNSYTKQHERNVSEADVKLAFEIINHRGINKKTTIISSEFTLDELIEVDEGIGSRIRQMCKDNDFNVCADPGKNYRLHDKG